MERSEEVYGGGRIRSTLKDRYIWMGSKEGIWRGLGREISQIKEHSQNAVAYGVKREGNLSGLKGRTFRELVKNKVRWIG